MPLIIATVFQEAPGQVVLAVKAPSDAPAAHVEAVTRAMASLGAAFLGARTPCSAGCPAACRTRQTSDLEPTL